MHKCRTVKYSKMQNNINLNMKNKNNYESIVNDALCFKFQLIHFFYFPSTYSQMSNHHNCSKYRFSKENN